MTIPIYVAIANMAILRFNLNSFKENLDEEYNNLTSNVGGPRLKGHSCQS